MRNISILLTILSLLFISCNNKVAERITELESLNEKLLDSIKELNITKLTSSSTYGLFDKSRYIKNDTARMWFYFHEDKFMPKYNVYEKIGKWKKGKLIYENMNKSMFEYKVLVESEKEKRIELIAEFKFKNGTSVEIPIDVGINVKE
jgi:hypothetical protein